MPTNVTPEYKKAKEAFQRAREPAERLTCLKEMLRTVPKHKGTDHLQADIKSRIKQLTEELAGPKKGGARTGPAHTVPPEGAAQIALVGPPNAGKSSLHARVTGSHAEIGPYPHTTRAPMPGMLPYKDVHFQLIDLPPISATYMESWMPNALQPAQAALLVVDLNTPGCVENVAAIRERLKEKRVSLVEEWKNPLDPKDLDIAGPTGASDENRGEGGDDLDDPFRLDLPTLLIANKSDINPDVDEIEVLEELIGVRYPALSISTESGHGLERIGSLLFQGLGIIRVYTKIPGHPPDADRPYTLFRGDTVLDVARLVHRDIAKSLKFARVWGSARFEGQQVGRDHAVSDGDILELHA
jgi:ribosome-interacting GTPase 1